MIFYRYLSASAWLSRASKEHLKKCSSCQSSTENTSSNDLVMINPSVALPFEALSVPSEVYCTSSHIRFDKWKRNLSGQTSSRSILCVIKLFVGHPSLIFFASTRGYPSQLQHALRNTSIHISPFRVISAATTDSFSIPASVSGFAKPFCLSLSHPLIYFYDNSKLLIFKFER